MKCTYILLLTVGLSGFLSPFKGLAENEKAVGVAESDKLSKEAKDSENLKSTKAPLTVDLPSQFSINQTSGKNALYKTFEVQQLGNDVGNSVGYTGMGTKVRSGFFRYRHYWWQNAKGELIAESSIRYLRAARIYDGSGQYIGKIHKRYFTWFSGKPIIDVYDLNDELVAEVSLRDDATDGRKVFVMKYLKLENEDRDDTYQKAIASFKYRKDSSGSRDLWLVNIYSDSEQATISAKAVDPRIIPFIPSYISFWDEVEKLDR